MVADFSALDAELDLLGAGPAVDAAALASSYAGTLERLTDIDAALSALAVDVRVDAAVALAQPYAVHVPTPVPPPASSSQPPPANHAETRLDSDEIALPNALPRVGNDESGELPLSGVTTESGSFALPYEEPLSSADFSADLTYEADVDELAEVSSVVEPRPSLFDRVEGEHETDRAAEADFAALFPDGAPEVTYDDTEIFDSSALAFDTAKPKLEPIENAFTEELDSAEFEIVMESTESGTQETPSSSMPPHPSTPPEKRPSFLGRLFGRKED